MTSPTPPFRRKRCPTGKIKHFNEAWADLAAQRQSADFDSYHRSYKCVCGWWHTYDKTKRTHNAETRESRGARRSRVKRGEPGPGVVRLMEKKRAQNRAKRARQRRTAELPLRVWEDDGGAVWLPRDDD